MNFLYELLPVFLFFITFKFVDIYAATKVGIVATLLQVLLTRYMTSKWDKKQLITLAVFVIFGSLTLYFHDPIFVKWKPSIIFWCFALIILFTQFVGEKVLIQRMMANMVEEGAVIPARVWRRLNACWAGFFALLGGINIFIAYSFSDAAWVNFKFYGITLALILFSVSQAAYMAPYFSAPSSEKKRDG